MLVASETQYSFERMQCKRRWIIRVAESNIVESSNLPDLKQSFVCTLPLESRVSVFPEGYVILQSSDVLTTFPRLSTSRTYSSRASFPTHSSQESKREGRCPPGNHLWFLIRPFVLVTISIIQTTIIFSRDDGMLQNDETRCKKNPQCLSHYSTEDAIFLSSIEEKKWEI